MADVISVSALNAYVKQLIETDIVLTDVAICGEISNFTNHIKTGHFYFTIKDEKCNVKVVMFKGNTLSLNFMPENGMSVILRGRISLYEAQGTFQIYADTMYLDGVGAMQAAFEKLRQRLSDEGLFDDLHKKKLPQIPGCVGIITSKTGAALQDILNVTKRRNPAAHILLCPTNVQGIDAAHEIANAVKTLDKSKRCDVIIIARGGGSKEDLWVFNNEEIARAVFACKTPVVSAIGHEIDFTILDFVADERAPTPSAAAEIVMPDMLAEIEKNYIVFENIYKNVQNYVDLCYNKLNTHKNSSAFFNTGLMPTNKMQELLALKTALQKTADNKLHSLKLSTANYAKLCGSLNPYGVLARGYGLVQKNDVIVKNIDEVNVGDEITVDINEGKLSCKITDIDSGGELWQKKN